MESNSGSATETDIHQRDSLSQTGNWGLGKSSDDIFRHLLSMSGDALRASSNSFLNIAHPSGSSLDRSNPYSMLNFGQSGLSPSTPTFFGASPATSSPSPSAGLDPSVLNFDPRLTGGVLHISSGSPQPDNQPFVPSVQLPSNINPNVDSEPIWDQWTTDQKREWLRLHDVKGTWEKNLSSKCSEVWLKIQQKIPLQVSTKPARSSFVASPVEPKWYHSLEYPDEPNWPQMSADKKRKFLKNHDVRGIWSKHLDAKCSEVWRQTHVPVHDTGHRTRQAAAVEAAKSQVFQTTTSLVRPDDRQRAVPLAVVPKVDAKATVADENFRESAAGDPSIVTDALRLSNFPRSQIPVLIELARQSNVAEITSFLNSTLYDQSETGERPKRKNDDLALTLAAHDGPKDEFVAPAPKRQKPNDDTARQLQEKNETIEILTREVARLREENAALSEKHHTLLQQFGAVTEMLKSIAQTSPHASPASGAQVLGN